MMLLTLGAERAALLGIERQSSASKPPSTFKVWPVMYRAGYSLWRERVSEPGWWCRFPCPSRTCGNIEPSNETGNQDNSDYDVNDVNEKVRHVALLSSMAELGLSFRCLWEPPRCARCGAVVSAPLPVPNLRLLLWKIEPSGGTGDRDNGNYDVNEKVRHGALLSSMAEPGLSLRCFPPSRTPNILILWIDHCW